jgi:hypothetical protein
MSADGAGLSCPGSNEVADGNFRSEDPEDIALASRPVISSILNKLLMRSIRAVTEHRGYESIPVND